MDHQRHWKPGSANLGYAALRLLPMVTLLVVSCQVETQDVWIFELETTEREISRAQGQAETQASREREVRTRANEILHLKKGLLEVQTNSLEIDWPEGEAESRPTTRRSTMTQVFDFAQGSLWTSIDSGTFDRRTVAEIAYDEETQLRREKLDFVSAYVLVPQVRRLPDIGLYSGDLRVVESRTEKRFGGKEARFVKLAAEPGAVWEILGSLDPLLPPEAWQREYYLVGALGISPGRARQIIEKLDGFPVMITVRSLPVMDKEVIVERSLRNVRKGSRGTHFRKPGETELRRVEEEDARLSDPGALLDLILRRAEDEAVTSGLLLRLSGCLSKERLAEVVAACGAVKESFCQIELARAALRFNEEAAWPLLRRFFFGEEGVRAMNIAEALIAQESRRAIPAILHVLGKRQEYTDTRPDAVAAWGVQHLRVASGASLEELSRIIPQVGEQGGIDPGQQLGAELDYWLRWWEREKSKYPAP